MTILYVSKENETLALSYRDSLNSGEEILPLDVSVRPDVYAGGITFAVDTNLENQTLGGYKPEEFAKLLETICPGEAKSKLQRIYFITGDAGMALQEGGETLAQKVALEMEKRGFTPFFVHAIAKPNAEHLTSSNVPLKDALQRGYNTFTASGPVAKISPQVLDAVNHLREQKVAIEQKKSVFGQARRAKQLGYIMSDIELLEQHSAASAEDVIALLRRQRTTRQLATSNYYRDVLSGLESTLRAKYPLKQETASASFLAIHEPPVEQEAFSASSTPQETSLTSTPPSLVTPEQPRPQPTAHPHPMALLLTPPVASQPKPKDKLTAYDKECGRPYTPYNTREDIHEKLDLYMGKRQREWGFHFNVLCIVTVWYYITDCLICSNRAGTKSRDTKLSGARKLDALVWGGKTPFFTTEERAALKEGRLGQIVKSHGGLERLEETFRNKDEACCSPMPR